MRDWAPATQTRWGEAVERSKNRVWPEKGFVVGCSGLVAAITAPKVVNVRFSPKLGTNVRVELWVANQLSTISQLPRLARLAFASSRRTYIRKSRESRITALSLSFMSRGASYLHRSQPLKLKATAMSLGSVG